MQEQMKDIEVKVKDLKVEIDVLKEEMQYFSGKTDLSEYETREIYEKQEKLKILMDKLAELTNTLKITAGTEEMPSEEFAAMNNMLPFPHQAPKIISHLEEDDGKNSEVNTPKSRKDQEIDMRRFEFPRKEYEEDR